MGAEITVIDAAGGTAAYWAQQTYRDSGPIILANSVWEMVDRVLTLLRNSHAVNSSDGSTEDRPAAISKLRVVGHGSPGRQGMGDSASTTNPRQLIALDHSGHLLNRAVLIQLRGHFEPTAVVELHGCEVGAGQRGQALRQALEGLWGVRVRAGTVIQDSGTPGFEVFAPPFGQR